MTIGHGGKVERSGERPDGLVGGERVARAKRVSGLGLAEAWFVHVANLAVGITGIVYAIFRWLVPPLDEFSLSHPGQPVWQHAHLVVAPLLVFALGLIWRQHILRLSQSSVRARRGSGWVLLGCAVPMILSGYLLQASTDPTWRSLWMWMHIGSSSVWIAGYLLHQLRRPR